MKATKKNTAKISVKNLKDKTVNVFEVKQLNGIIGGTENGGGNYGGFVGMQDFHI
jgi:hypothetical protein